jgi:hypothetical protein
MKAIVTFQGFTESSERRTGTEDLYWDVIRNFSGNEITTDWPRRWTADVKELAALLARQRVESLAMVSYSHGQAAACQFAAHCYELGIDVDLWLACDPVYRPAWLPRWNWLQPFAFRALLKTGNISIPRNIRRVAGVRQETDLPRGHTLVPSSPHTVVRTFDVLPFGHTTIDNAGEWFALVDLELRQWSAPPKAIPV